MPQLRQTYYNLKNPRQITLVGGHCDVSYEERRVSFQQGQDTAKEHNVLFLESSAKSAYNVKEIFIQTAREYFATLGYPYTKSDLKVST